MTLSPVAQTALIDLVRKVAATEIMPRFRQLPSGAIRTKSAPDDLVTDADLASEEAITAAIPSILPGAVVVGEEAVAADASLLEAIGPAETCVILDPIDGTWNFANGLATFGVLLAVTHNGETEFGLLYDPVMDDWVMASRGGGCWFGRPDAQPVRLGPADPVTPQAATGFLPVTLFPKEQRNEVALAALEFGRVGQLRCSCHEYRMLAQGRVNFSVNGMMKPWDHAAGVLAVTEAGGAARQLSGRPYSPTEHEGRLCVATSPDLLDTVANRFAAFAA